MPTLGRIMRVLLIGTLTIGILSACIIGEDDEQPTQTPIVIVPTTAEPDTASVATATTVTPPTPTSEPTATTTAVLRPSPTVRPTQPVAPTATRPRITVPTPTPQAVSSDRVQIPSDPLLILPQAEYAPVGMEVVDEGPIDLDWASSDARDREARADLLTTWGFQGGAFREFQTLDEALIDPSSQMTGMITGALIMGSPDDALLEMNTYLDEIILLHPERNAVEVAVDPLGDASRAALGEAVDADGNSFRFGVLLVAAGEVSLKFLAVAGEQYDPFPELIRMAQISLDNLRYSGTPPLGKILLETDFSNWIDGEYGEGEIFYGDDDLYHIRVDQGDGAWVYAYSLDHEPFGDVAVSVDLLLVSGDPSSSGCVLSRVDQVAQAYDYALCIDGYGNIEALYEEFDSEGSYTFEPLIPTGTVAVEAPAGWTTLTIIARGEEFWFLVNGVLVATARHVGPPAGSAGIIVNHFAEAPTEPAEYVFTNMVVQAVE